MNDFYSTDNYVDDGYFDPAESDYPYDEFTNEQSYSSLDNLTDEEIEAAILAEQQKQSLALKALDADLTTAVQASHDDAMEEYMRQMIEPYKVSTQLKLPPVKPVIAIGDTVLCSEGNISAVVGEAKSKKTFLCTALAGGMRSVDEVQPFGLQRNRCRLLWIDTEQSIEHIQKVMFRINALCSIPLRFDDPKIYTLSVRSESPMRRLELVETAIRTHKPNLIIIDGISDLMSNSNNLEASEALVSLLLTWSTNYKCHIMNVLHTNPNSDKARGHLGSTLMRKAETVIFVHKVGEVSIVEPQYCRNKPFERFAFHIEELSTDKYYEDISIGLGIPCECDLPADSPTKEDDSVRILRDEFGGSAERKLLCHKMEDILGITQSYASMKIMRAIERGLLRCEGKVVMVA